MKTINSFDNKKIKELIRLKKTSERKKQGLIIIDGLREIELALESGIEIIDLFFCPEISKNEKMRLKGIDPESITIVSVNVFKKICYKENPDGYFALARPRELNIGHISLNKNPLIVILENVEKPGNLGAVIRTSFAAKVDLIIVSDNQTDIYNPNVIRASEGLLFKQKIVSLTTNDTITWLKKNNINSYAAATTSKTDYTKVNMKKSTAIVLGSESQGLSRDWLNKADELIKIPMQSGIDSLNVSVSAAILIYEAKRQRV
jgi:TrmH family RNA methyltransferase